MTLRDVLTVVEDYEIFMINTKEKNKNTIYLRKPFSSAEYDLKVKEIYADCGICIELRFNKPYWKTTDRQKV